MTTKLIKDGLTGLDVEVIVTSSGKMFAVEGFDYGFIKSVQPRDFNSPAGRPGMNCHYGDCGGHIDLGPSKTPSF